MSQFLRGAGGPPYGRLAEQPAGPRAVGTVMRRGSQGILPTSTAGVGKRAGLPVGSSSTGCDRVPSTASLVADLTDDCLTGSMAIIYEHFTNLTQQREK